MRTFLSLLLCCLCSPILTLSQENRIDSLKALLEKPTADSTRLRLLNDLAYYYYSSNPDTGILTAEKAIRLAAKLDDPAGSAAAYNSLGVNYWAKGKDSLALEAFQQTMTWHSKTSNKNGQGRALNNMGLIYYNMALYSKAIEQHEKAVNLFKETGFQAGIANSHNNIGVIFLALNDYPRAMQSFLNVLREENIPESLKADARSNLGLIYKNQGAYQAALKQYHQAVLTYEKLGNKQGKANTLGNIGTVYDKLHLPDTAIFYFKKALELNLAIGNDRRLASDYTNIGIAYKNQHRQDSAFSYLQQAIITYKKTTDKANTASALHEMAGLYNEKGKYADPSKALSLEKQALQLAKEAESPETESSVWGGLHEIYEEQHQYAAALHAYKEQIRLRDTVYNTNKEKEILTKSMQYDFDKKEAVLKATHEQENALSAAEIGKQKLTKNILAGGAAALLLGSTGAYILYKRKRDAVERQKEAESRTLIAETEMKALRAQMNPHFIFNSLNAISSFIHTNDLDAADDYLARFARIMRMILENSESREISLADDLEALRLYMQLETKRMKHPFTYEINTPAGIDPENTLVPPLLLQPFVENSIWHGLAALDAPGKITISFEQDGDLLRCIVQDNGIGFPEGKEGSLQKPGTKKSMGMTITAARVAMANHTESAGNKLRIIHPGQGVRIEIDIPLVLAC